MGVPVFFELCRCVSTDTPIAERINGCVIAFSKIGVSKDMLEAYLKHKIETSKESEIVMLIGLFTAIKTGAILYYISSEFHQYKV